MVPDMWEKYTNTTTPPASFRMAIESQESINKHLLPTNEFYKRKPDVCSSSIKCSLNHDIYATQPMKSSTCLFAHMNGCVPSIHITRKTIA